MKRGLLPFNIIDIGFFLCSLIYLAAEFRFNLRLLDVAGSAKADAGAIEQVADFGRAVSGFGFTLLVLGLFAREGFRLSSKRARWIFGVFTAVCLLPFIIFPPQAAGILFVAPILFGLFIIWVSRGRWVFHTVLGIALMGWPAMYEGQKILVENLVVEPTSWQERQHARNVMMLRAGLEDCLVEVQGLWLCQGDKTTPEMRAIRAMITALWMHNPAAIIAALEPQKDRIIDNTVRKGIAFDPKGAYEKYKQLMADEREKMATEMKTKYYQPYVEASENYQAALSPEKVKAEVDRLWKDIEAQTDRAWNQYLQAAQRYRDYHAKLSDQVLARNNVALRKLDEYCATRNCPRGNVDRMALRIKDEAETAFIRETGFPPYVASKQEFMTYPRARQEFEQAFAERMVSMPAGMAIILPSDWFYDERYFRFLLTEKMQQQAKAVWQKNFGGKLKPGLDEKGFYAAMKIPPLPPLEEILMSEEDFTKGYSIPQSRAKIKAYIEEMEKEAEQYGNDGELAEKGRQYVRSVYVPAIALILSLLIVTLTMLRGVNAALVWGIGHLARQIKWKSKISLSHLRYAVIGGLLVVLAVGPFALPNSYTDSRVYEVYVAEARAHNPLTATLIDWSIHMQPVVYAVMKPFI